MDNWIPKNKIVKFAITAALFSIVLYFSGLFIIFREIKKVENFYRDTESEFSKEERISAIKSITGENKEVIQTLEDFFIQKDDEIKFIEQIEKIARSSVIKFEITSIDVKANQGDSFEEDIGVKIEIEGSWRNIVSFIDKLEKMPFGVLINNINLDANIPGNWSGFIEFFVFRKK